MYHNLPPPPLFWPHLPGTWLQHPSPPPYSTQFFAPPPPPPPPLPPYYAQSYGSGIPLGIPVGWKGRGSTRGDQRNVFSCKQCDKEYKSEESYRLHLQSHVKCSQCDFTALPKQMKEHGIVHSLPEFLSFSSSDDIKKWREERKKNFPTSANVTKKQQLLEKRKERGDILDTPLYKYVNRLISDYDRGRGRGRGRGGKNHWRGRDRRNGGWHSKQSYEYQQYDEHGCDTEVREDESKEKMTIESKDQLMVSNDDHSSLNVDDKKPLFDENEICKGQRGRQNRGRGGGRGRGRYVYNKRPHSVNEQELQTKRKRKMVTMNEIIPKKPTLLEKLLAAEIRKEHNTVLQCVRYTVKNNFFNSISNT